MQETNITQIIRQYETFVVRPVFLFQMIYDYVNLISRILYHIDKS